MLALSAWSRPRLYLCAAALALSACDGGSGSSPAPTPTPTPTPAPVNVAPSFTSATSVSVPENQTAVLTATATDPESNPLSFSVSGGEDGALFQITPAGVLSFRAAPDYEVPKDVGADRVYKVELSVSDGQAITTQAVTVTVTDISTGGYRTRLVASGFATPNKLMPMPGDAQSLLVSEKTGRIRILNRATGAVASTPFLDLSAQVATDGNRGLIGMEPAPDFAQTGAFYVSLVTQAGNLEVRRYRPLAGNPRVLDPATADVIFSLAEPSNRYVGGWIGFGPDNFLYVGTGATRTESEVPSQLSGKILRIDPTRDDFPADPLRDYAIPAGNPLSASVGLPEIWVLGFRNPQHASFDTAYGDLWVGDFGSPNTVSPYYEFSEIDLIQPGDAGYSYAADYPARPVVPVPPVPAGSRYPTVSYERSLSYFDHGESWVAGYVYRGPVESLQGLFISGNEMLGLLRTFPVSAAARAHQRENWSSFSPFPASQPATSGFGEDQDKNLYILGISGDIYILEPN